MDDTDLLQALEVEARALVDLGLTPTDLERPLTWDDGWTVGGVLGHLSSVQRWATALCDEPGTQVRRRDLEPAPDGEAVLAWYAAGLDPLLAAFDGTDPQTTVHTWAGSQPRRWWLRRLAHETAVHRWDVEAAVHGAPGARPVDATLAADGIEELFENFVPLVGDRDLGHGETMHVHATDAPGEWQLTFGSPGITVERRHAKADVALRGPASDLLLLLWNRLDADTTDAEVFGERAVLDRWRDTVRF